MRTEQEILKDFEELGYKYKIWSVKCGIIHILNKDKYPIPMLIINKEYKNYFFVESAIIDMELHKILHKLLHELFECWGWFEC